MEDEIILCEKSSTWKRSQHRDWSQGSTSLKQDAGELRIQDVSYVYSWASLTALVVPENNA